MGSCAGLIGHEPVLGKHAGLVKELVKWETGQKHQCAWENLEICGQAKAFLEGPSLRTTKYDGSYLW